jgi:Uma2 family endonuclease
MASRAMVLLEQLHEESGAKVEIDVDGTIIVTPASDEHVVAASDLVLQLGKAAPAGVLVVAEGPIWAPLGRENPSYIPDVSVIEAVSLRSGRDGQGLVPAPLVVVEIISPESRRRDLGEKAEGYWHGGAGTYWTIDLPGLAAVERPTLVIRRRGVEGWEPSDPMTGIVTIEKPFPLLLDLDRLSL